MVYDHLKRIGRWLRAVLGVLSEHSRANDPASENDPVSQHEYILRRIPGADVVEGVVQITGVTPRENDTDGLSFFRSSFVDEVQLAASGKGKSGYWVAKIPVTEIAELKYSLIPKRDPSLPGHCILPEITRQRYKGNKQAVLEELDVLARLATKYLTYSTAHGYLDRS